MCTFTTKYIAARISIKINEQKLQCKLNAVSVMKCYYCVKNRIKSKLHLNIYFLLFCTISIE